MNGGNEVYDLVCLQNVAVVLGFNIYKNMKCLEERTLALNYGTLCGVETLVKKKNVG
jgi:hypothetical protein